MCSDSCKGVRVEAGRVCVEPRHVFTNADVGGSADKARKELFGDDLADQRRARLTSSSKMPVPSTFCKSNAMSPGVTALTSASGASRISNC